MEDIFGDAVQRLFADVYDPAGLRAAERGAPQSAAWQACVASGFLDALVPEAQGGAGLPLADALPLALAAGRHALPVPFVHTLFARAWLAAAGVPAPEGPMALAAFGVRAGNEGIEAAAVPWGRTATHVLAQLHDGVRLLAVDDCVAREPVGETSLDADLRWPAHAGVAIADAAATSLPPLSDLAAAACAALMAGAMERVLAYTLDYANQRSQFGKPIGRFQAVQQQISVMAEHVWAARMAAQLSFQNQDWSPSPMLAALGKARASQAAPLVADIAHAVHGAIGVTEEYDLQCYTRRLREWRLAAGTESWWAERIGAALVDSGEDALDFLRGSLQ